MRIVLTGGGTGGHIKPFEPIIDALRVLHAEQHDKLPIGLERKKMQIYFFGVCSQADKEWFAQQDVPAPAIPSK